jgi:serine/threonine protein kinase
MHEFCRHCRSRAECISRALTVEQCPECAATLQGMGPSPRRGTGSTLRPIPFLIPAECWKHFTFECVLGEGSSGIVLLARQLSTGQRVAVKVLKRPGDQESRSRLRIEAEALSRLVHPRIVKMLATLFGDYPYLVLEFVQGGTLRSLLSASGPLPLATALSHALDCLSGLEHCHSVGFIHRDLKPRNILLTRAGRAKLADFGIVSSPTPDVGMPSTGARLGTPRYMSPEQVRGEPAGPRSDLYSVGLILYEMLVGHSPFPPEEAPGGDDPSRRPSMAPLRRVAPHPLCDLIEQTLAARSTDRPKDAATLAQRLRSLQRRPAMV